MRTQRTTTTIIGAGQAGLAMSKCLTDLSIDHIVLDRGHTGHSWRTERWDALRLLTPNWMTRLPGHRYRGDDPDGFMTAAEVAQFLDTYRQIIDAPVQHNTWVEAVAPTDSGFAITTSQGPIESDTVVVASGACSTPKIPAMASALPTDVQQLAPIHYRNPAQIADGDVLVVGASASGAQIADELARAGRAVTMAVSNHVRTPRTYRGMDIQWWLDTIGVLDETIDDVDDVVRVRRTPSLQLVGTTDGRDIDLNALMRHGVRPVGKLAGITESKLQFSGSLANVVASADLKLGRLLDRIDDYVVDAGLSAEVGPGERPAPTVLPADTPLDMDLSQIGSVIWATGFKPNYPWLPDHVVDHKGGLIHDGGVICHPGMYAMGLPFGRRRKSAFLDGVGPDAVELSAHLRQHLDTPAGLSRQQIHGALQL